VFAGVGSLHNRIAFAVGINSLGLETFFHWLFKALGIPLTPNVAYYLEIKEKNRKKPLEKCKTKDAKLAKNKRNFDKLAKNTKIAMTERLKRTGTYRRGQNLLDDNLDEVLDVATQQKQPAKKKYKPSGSTKLFCEYCGIKGHATQQSKACTAKGSTVKMFRKEDGALLSDNPPPLPLGAAVEPTMLTAEALLAQDDCHAMDSLPFDAEYNSVEEQDLAARLLGDYDSDEEDALALFRGTI
jgi:hypothetical protein